MGSGGYSSQDEKKYIEFMKQIMNQEFPKGHYVVNGFTDFNVLADGDSEQGKRYEIKAKIEFKVNDSK
ncbi:hypothetical protein [Lysinibacillus telephonicus]|uniref:hypothetical protein n=1 Tax=Lysinibacillus telephonicus TaxID=1714840 RepID=UPI000F830B0D|nr:hypothetical protein [Lysinibacillus telephonicus]